MIHILDIKVIFEKCFTASPFSCLVLLFFLLRLKPFQPRGRTDENALEYAYRMHEFSRHAYIMSFYSVIF